MLNKIHEILRDPRCEGNIKACTFGVTVASAYIITAIFGCAWLDYSQAERKFDQRLKRAEVQVDILKIHLDATQEALEDKLAHEVVKLDQRFLELEDSIMPSAFRGRR